MSEPKAHHHVGCFHLKWFTKEENRKGKLWVTDTKTNRQWGPQCIEEVATEKNFYKGEHPGQSHVNWLKIRRKFH